MTVKFKHNGNEYTGNVIWQAPKSIYVEVVDTAKGNRRNFDATDTLGSKQLLSTTDVIELFND